MVGRKRAIPSKYGRDGRICICQIIKDEHEYIEEWIEYHHNIGVSHFYLIEDFNSKSHSDILAKYNYVELYKLENIVNDEEQAKIIAGLYRQRVVWSVWQRLWYDKYDYMAFIDVDEYIDLDRNGLEDILNKGRDYPIVELMWKNMTSGGHISHPNNGEKYSIVKTYTDYNFAIGNTKMIINCCDEWRDLFREENCDYIPHAVSKIKRLKKAAYLRHYLFKSFEEFVNRLSVRGELCKREHNRKIDDFFKGNPDMLQRKEEMMNLIQKRFNVTCNTYPSPYQFENSHMGITEDEYIDIIQLLEIRKPKRIIELGTGYSTKIFKTYIKRHGGEIFSIEHNDEFSDDNVVIMPLEENTSLEVRGMSFGTCNKFVGLEDWLENQQKFDFILIDAPFGFGFREKYKYSRVQTLSFVLLDKITDDAVVMYHDSQRANAKSTLREFERLLRIKGFMFNKTKRSQKDGTKEMTTYHIKKQ